MKRRALRRRAVWFSFVIVVAGCNSDSGVESDSAIAPRPPSAPWSNDAGVGNTVARTVRPSPDLGAVTDGPSLVAALRSSGPIDNQTQASKLDERAPDVSICAIIVETNEPTVGTLIHQALATRDGIYGVVLVFERSDRSYEVRMYGTGDADPATGGCPLWITAEL